MMKKQNNNPYQTNLSACQCIGSLIGWLALVGIVCLTIIFGNEPIPGRCLPFILQTLWIISMSIVLLVRMHVMQRLIMLYFPRKNSLLRLGLLFLMICLPPVPEIFFLIKTKETQEVYSFWLDLDQLD